MMNQLKKQGGFSLLEVLIALLVLSIGLLGLAALQAVSLKSNHGAYTRTQAIYLAYDIIDRIKANRNQALSGGYDLAMNASAPAASATNLADTDLNEWMTDYVTVLLPGGDASVDCAGTAPSDVCTVTIQWDESRLGGTASDGSATAQFVFSSQI